MPIATSLLVPAFKVHMVTPPMVSPHPLHMTSCSGEEDEGGHNGAPHPHTVLVKLFSGGNFLTVWDIFDPLL